MRKSLARKWVLASLLGSAVSFGVAFAGEPDAFQAKRQEHRQQMLEKYDADKNGSLDDAERQKMHEERSAERFKALDTNGDGSLSLAEFQAMKRGWHHGRHGHPKR